MLGGTPDAVQPAREYGAARMVHRDPPLHCSSMRPFYSPLAAVLFDPVLPRDEFDALLHFHVDTVDGDEVGAVDGWERNDENRPTKAIVAQGWWGRRHFAVPVETILEIDRDRRRILLSRGAVPPERPGLLQRLFG
jgi:hypothetical protein